MTEDERREIVRLKAQVELLQDVVAFLCLSVVPPELLDRFVERLDTPIAGETADTTRDVHNAIDRFIDKIKHRRPITGED